MKLVKIKVNEKLGGRGDNNKKVNETFLARWGWSKLEPQGFKWKKEKWEVEGEAKANI